MPALVCGPSLMFILLAALSLIYKLVNWLMPKSSEGKSIAWPVAFGFNIGLAKSINVGS